MQSEAQEALTSVEQALNNLQNQVSEIANEAVEVTGNVVSTSALSWLVVAMILVGFAGLGGYQLNDEREILQEARERNAERTAAGDRVHAEPLRSEGRPRRVGNA